MQEVKICLKTGEEYTTHRNNVDYQIWGIDTTVTTPEFSLRLRIPWQNIKEIREKIR